MQPARAEAVRSTTYRVTVTYNGFELSFQNPPEMLLLGEGEILILDFQGIPGDMIPGVTFSKGGDDFGSPLGPFQDALQTAGRVILRGNSGSVGTFKSRALLSPMLRGREQPIFSTNELRIDNVLNVRSAKEVQVLVRPKPLPSEEPVEVTVDLDEVALFAPDAVVWSFVYENLEPRAYEPLLYLDAESTPPPPAGTGPFGPFQGLSVAGIFEPLGEDRILAYRLITSGNNDVPGQYHFNVGVRPTLLGPTREILCATDPVIDNNGPPNAAA